MNRLFIVSVDEFEREAQSNCSIYLISEPSKQQGDSIAFVLVKSVGRETESVSFGLAPRGSL